MTTIHGERVNLRPVQIDDAQAIFAGTQQPEGRRLTGTHAEFTLEQVQTYVERAQTSDDRATFTMIDAADARPVGEVVLMDIDTDNHSAGLRIALFYDADFGKGYGSEAMRLALKHAFETLKLHRVSLEVFAFNPRAIHVYEKVGFKREGVLRDALYWDSEYVDAIVMGILADEYFAIQ